VAARGPSAEQRGRAIGHPVHAQSRGYAPSVFDGLRGFTPHGKCPVEDDGAAALAGSALRPGSARCAETDDLDIAAHLARHDIAVLEARRTRILHGHETHDARPRRRTRRRRRWREGRLKLTDQSVGGEETRAQIKEVADALRAGDKDTLVNLYDEAVPASSVRTERKMTAQLRDLRRIFEGRNGAFSWQLREMPKKKPGNFAETKCATCAFDFPPIDVSLTSPVAAPL
jgi:hypothetical protein